ncbi:MAG: prolyl oligopeptidase family serine peptidase, partial [Streptomycetaceae bacterium]|nr:prolyl oligopeptidase family serine peptidase [Streptomycetaceae bacterium]
MFTGRRTALDAIRTPGAVVPSPYDGNDLYPDEYGRVAEPGNAFARQQYEQSARYLESLRPVIEHDSRIIAEMRAFERRHPDFTTGGGAVYLHREPGSAATKLMFRDRAGHTRVLKADFSPSLEYPEVYPRGFWASPDGAHVVYSDADSVDESGATLHMVRTDTGEAAALPVDAAFPSGSWIDNHRFLYAKAAPGRRQPWRQHWQLVLRTVGPDGEVTDRPAPEFERAADGSRYDVVPGPLSGTATLLSYSNILNTPQSVRVVDLDGRGRGFTVQRENRVLARVRPGPVSEDGSRPLFVLRNDLRSFRAGRVVLVDPRKRQRFRRPSRRQVVAGRRGDIIREIEVIDRGPGQLPALALSIRRHGAEARVDIVDLKKSRWRGNPTAARRWTVPLPDAQPITAAGKRDRVRGWYGTVAAMTPTPGADGRGGLHIEYAARESVPHRLYQLDTIEPGAVPRRIAGPSRAEARAKGVPDVTVTLHRARSGALRKTSLLVVRPAHAPAEAPLPSMYSAYPFFNLAVQNPNFDAAMARAVSKGIAWVHASVYGGGAQSYREVTAPRAAARRRALRDMAAGTRLLDGIPGLDRTRRFGFFQSAGGMTLLDALRHLPHRFAGFIGNVPQTDVLREGWGNHPVYMRVGSRRDRRAGHAQSGGIWEAAPVDYRKPIRLVPGVVDFRVPPEGVMRTAAALEDARMRRLGPLADKLKDGPRSSLYVVANAGGHFPGVGPQAVISTVVGEVAGCHPLRTPVNTVNTTGLRVPPGIVVVPNAQAPLLAAGLRSPAAAPASARSGP